MPCLNLSPFGERIEMFRKDVDAAHSVLHSKHRGRCRHLWQRDLSSRLLLTSGADRFVPPSGWEQKV